ncbi:MAG: hypothetical protein KI790_07735 [Cyclobacteriaceae bacterium]|nr:hypothetical protein [Cyclobacteriaceae bacterium HetDA_MAG_MS6]
MKNVILAAFTFVAINQTIAQGFELPTEDKAVVYITRVTSLGAAISFKYFHNKNYIGKFNSGKYIRYECEPGKHLFWARSENRDFITAEFEAGKIYIIDAQARMGGMKAQVRLIPVDGKDAKLLAKVEKLVNKKPPKQHSPHEIKEMNAMLMSNIDEGMEVLEKKKAKGKVGHITTDMNYEIGGG